jgi:hypothetical protein
MKSNNFLFLFFNLIFSISLSTIIDFIVFISGPYIFKINLRSIQIKIIEKKMVFK